MQVRGHMNSGQSNNTEVPLREMVRAYPKCEPEHDPRRCERCALWSLLREVEEGRFSAGIKNRRRKVEKERDELRASLLEAVRTIILATEIIGPDIDRGRFPVYAKQLQAFYATDPAALALASVPEVPT